MLVVHFYDGDKDDKDHPFGLDGMSVDELPLGCPLCWRDTRVLDSTRCIRLTLVIVEDCTNKRKTHSSACIVPPFGSRIAKYALNLDGKNCDLFHKCSP